MSKPFDYRAACWIHILKHSEGGMSRSCAKLLLDEARIPHRFEQSHFVGNYAVLVQPKHEKKAMRIL